MTDNHKVQLKTCLYNLHRALDARMVAFAGYEMPLQYKSGILQEHLHTRTHAGLFDVSHMGQITVRAKSGSLEDAALALERLMPVDIVGLAERRQRYSVLTNDNGGILDDLMIANRGDHYFLIVNAARKHADFAHMVNNLQETCDIQLLQDRALMALQGPSAEAAIADIAPQLKKMTFMDVQDLTIYGADCIVSRSGYTGEDGFELSVPLAQAEAIAKQLLEHEEVEPIGLGARDSLRLEAGLCLHGSDISEATTPIEAGLVWAIGRVRRKGGARAGGFIGATRILQQIDGGVECRRVGLRPQGRAPVRAGAELFETETSKNSVGTVTSGVFGPSVNGPVAMGYLPDSLSKVGTQIFAAVRGKRLPVAVCDLPFVEHNFKR